MLTRPSAAPAIPADIKSLDRAIDTIRGVPNPAGTEPRMAAPLPAAATAPPQRMPPADGSLSIIGSDLTIIGQGLRIITRGTLKVEGRVEGDVAGNEVIIGETGRVTGVVCGNSVTVLGEVSGTVKGLKVALKAGARVAGDIHHRELSVDQGAHLDGRVRRPQDLAELTPSLE